MKYHTVEEHAYLCEYAWTHEHPAHSRNISPQSLELSPQREKNVKNMLKFHTSSSSLGRYVFGSEISYNKAPPRLPGLAC
jgi:hypothetical protein